MKKLLRLIRRMRMMFQLQWRDKTSRMPARSNDIPLSSLFELPPHFSLQFLPAHLILLRQLVPLFAHLSIQQINSLLQPSLLLLTNCLVLLCHITQLIIFGDIFSHKLIICTSISGFGQTVFGTILSHHFLVFLSSLLKSGCCCCLLCLALLGFLQNVIDL